MAYRLLFTQEAADVLAELQSNPSLKVPCKAVMSTLKKMEADLRYPGLNTHEMKNMDCHHGRKMYTAYAQNHTPGAYRVFWCYCGKPQGDITILQISPHL